MKRLLLSFARYSQWTPLHVLALTLLSTGLFISSTSSEMGPFAPLLVSEGVYMVLFALLLEAFVAARVLLMRLALGSSNAESQT